MVGKNDLVKQVALRIKGNKNNVTANDIQLYTELCDTLADVILDELIAGERVQWRNFLTLEVVTRGARKGRDPRTNEVKDFPPVKSISCKISKKVKELIKE